MSSILQQNTIYINLKERPDRNRHALEELAKLGITTPVRLNAMKHTFGAIGCTMSHIMAIEYAMKNEMDHVFICEDDITFLNPPLLLENLRKFMNQSQRDSIVWDVLIIGGNNCPPYDVITPECSRVYNCQTTTGYIVNSHYYTTLLNNFRESARNLMREPTNGRMFALDIYWKQLQQGDNWYMITPPTVIQYTNYSNIENTTKDYSGLMLDMEKRWLREKMPLFMMRQQQQQQQNNRK